MIFDKNNNKIHIAPVVFGSIPCELQNPDGNPYSGVLSKVEQYVVAYNVDWDMLKNILPEGYRSLRAVLRINVELLSDVKWLAGRSYNRVELNTPIEYGGKKGWFNLVTWEDDCDSIVYGRDVHGIPKIHAKINVEKIDRETKILVQNGDFTFLNISFTGVNKVGGCPKEDDNEGTFHHRYLPGIGDEPHKVAVNSTAFVTVEKIDQNREYCECSFKWHKPEFHDYPLGYKLVHEICAIENQMILGAYVVCFERNKNYGGQILL